MKNKWMNKLFMCVAILGLSSLTFADSVNKPNIKETVEIKVDTKIFTVTPCVVKEVGYSTENMNPRIECHYILNGNEYHYKIEPYEKLSKQILEDIETVKKQPESFYKLIMDNISYFNLFYTTDDIERSLDYIQPNKTHVIIDTFLQIYQLKEKILNLLENQEILDADYSIINNHRFYVGKASYIQDQYKTIRIMKTDNYKLDELFQEIWGSLSDVDKQKNVKLIEQYFSKFAMEKDMQVKSVSKVMSEYDGTVPNDYTVLKDTIVTMPFPKTILNNSMENGSEDVQNMNPRDVLFNFSVIWIVFWIVLMISRVALELLQHYFKKQKHIVLDGQAQPYQNQIPKPDISKVEELINQVELVKNSFKTIGYEYKLDTEILDMMTRFNLLKEAVHSEMNRIDWANNTNFDITQQYQTVIDRYIEVMDKEYSKIKEKFDNVIKKDVENRIKNIQIIQDLK